MAKSFQALAARTMSQKARAKAKARASELMGELLLAELRTLSGKSQKQAAETLGIKQPSFAKIEKQQDMQISTLRKVVKALGGELEMLVRLPRGVVRLHQFID